MKAPQHGFNLVSLMIGVALSMVSILAMLSLYKNIIGISVRSIQDSKQDGQVATGLLIAERELLNAGFGLNPTPVPVILLDKADLTDGILSGQVKPFDTASATTTPSPTGNAIIWNYIPSTSGSAADAICVGLIMKKNLDPQTGAQLTTGTLLRLQGASNCKLVSQWSSTKWTSTKLIEANQAAAFFSAHYSVCWPFGKSADAASAAMRLQVTLTAINSTVDANSADPQPAYVKSKSTVCLRNLEKI